MGLDFCTSHCLSLLGRTQRCVPPMGSAGSDLKCLLLTLNTLVPTPHDAPVCSQHRRGYKSVNKYVSRTSKRIEVLQLCPCQSLLCMKMSPSAVASPPQSILTSSIKRRQGGKDLAIAVAQMENRGRMLLPSHSFPFPLPFPQVCCHQMRNSSQHPKPGHPSCMQCYEPCPWLLPAMQELWHWADTALTMCMPSGDKGGADGHHSAMQQLLNSVFCCIPAPPPRGA